MPHFFDLTINAEPTKIDWIEPLQITHAFKGVDELETHIWSTNIDDMVGHFTDLLGVESNIEPIIQKLGNLPLQLLGLRVNDLCIAASKKLILPGDFQLHGWHIDNLAKGSWQASVADKGATEHLDLGINDIPVEIIERWTDEELKADGLLRTFDAGDVVTFDGIHRSPVNTTGNLIYEQC